MILKSKFTALTPQNQDVINTILSYIAEDKNGYIQHPLEEQIGSVPNYTLGDLISDLVLGIPPKIENENGETVTNPLTISWFTTNSEVKTWVKRTTQNTVDPEDKIDLIDENKILVLPEETKQMLEEILGIEDPVN